MAIDAPRNVTKVMKRQARWGVLLLGCAICTSSTQIGSSRNPSDLFGQNAGLADNAIVMFRGQAHFFIENGAEPKPIAANTLTLSIDQAGAVRVTYQGTLYLLDLHKGIACPLGQFVDRNGSIAYAVSTDNREVAPRLMQQEGLVAHKVGHSIAKEFFGTVFAKLLEAAAFSETTPLPKDLQKRLLSNYNEIARRPAISYINSDHEIVYKVHLMSEPARIEIAGVPLRYKFEYEFTGLVPLSSIGAYSQNWSLKASLTDFSHKTSRVLPISFGCLRYLYARRHYIGNAANKVKPLPGRPW
jgi:hypothetical protein